MIKIGLFDAQHAGHRTGWRRGGDSGFDTQRVARDCHQLRRGEINHAVLVGEEIDGFDLVDAAKRHGEDKPTVFRCETDRPIDRFGNCGLALGDAKAVFRVGRARADS